MQNFQIQQEEYIFSSEKVNVIAADIILPNQNKVTWNIMNIGGIAIGVPITENKTVLLVTQWRLAAKGYLTDFVGARMGTNDDKLGDLKKEMKEELGLEGGEYKFMFKSAQGAHIRGINHIYSISNFIIQKQQLDPNEFLDILELPIDGLFNKLSQDYICQAHTLLAAKLLEENLDKYL